uniref:CHCH domain-containing protein n=1 Tax=Chenopodium quinoa TaxID=63459 RepID=A0A803M4L2_CHEQI
MASKVESPPYPSAAKISDSSCFPQYTASLKCLEQNNSEKSKCQEFFDDYKECKKKEDSKSLSFLPKLQVPQLNLKLKPAINIKYYAAVLADVS